MLQPYLRNSTVKVSELLHRVVMDLANVHRGLLTSEFILCGMVEQKDSIVLKIFDELRLDAEELRLKIIETARLQLETLPPLDSEQTGSMQISLDVENLFRVADQKRQDLGDVYISTGALFLACFDATKGTQAILQDLQLQHDACRTALLSLRGAAKISQKDDESKHSLLAQYTTDITALARKETLDPVIGREREITRVIEILSRRKKNNPVLIGESGVGKTVIVEGLAQQIASGDVPEHLLSKKILLLEIGTLIAGARIQGEFEERLTKIRDEIVAAAGEVILFIDELHTVVGAGRNLGGGLDASNMLKPALAKGLLQCLGATTTKEYKQYIESDKALERRFQPVRVAEPTLEQTVSVLQGLRAKYQAHHQIEYDNKALQAAAELSHRYLPNRFLPDKAIDLLDEAGAAKRLQIVYNPPELRKMEKERNDLLSKKTEAFNQSDFELMSRYQMEISKLEIKLSQAREKFTVDHKEEKTNVSKEDIASIVHRMTGIPVARMVAEEATRLRSLEDNFKKRIIGQTHAVISVSNAIRRNRAGLRRPDKPIASFLFLGATGVGKTELAKAIAAEMMDNEASMIRLDMSEYSERHEAAKLIGSPPGYVGYGEGGQLTERIRKSPYSVVLFDEIEKAHPDVLNIMLQILDEGWLTDAEGMRVSFQNAVIVCTSNLGSSILTEQRRPVGIGVQSFNKEDEAKEIMSDVRRFLKPEFINRLDEVIIFDRLEEDDLRKILELHIDDLATRLKKKGVKLTVKKEVKNRILAQIDTLNYGARPLQRKLQQLVENKIAMMLLEKKKYKSITVYLDGKDKDIVCQ